MSTNNLDVWGRRIFGAALCGFGIQHFLYGDFVAGRAPAWPSSLPGQMVWAVLSGTVLVACGVAISVGMRLRQAAILSGGLIASWALMRHVPALVFQPGALVIGATGKALALAGGCLAFLPVREDAREPVDLSIVGRICLGIFMVLGGIQHFMYPAFVATLIPSWIPGALFWVYAAGVLLIVGGGGMQWPRTSRLSAGFSGLMIFSWVFVVHLPRAVAAIGAAQRRNEWTSVVEALAFSGLAFFLTERPSRSASESERHDSAGDDHARLKVMGQSRPRWVH